MWCLTLGSPLIVAGVLYAGLWVFAPGDVPYQPDAALLPKPERVVDDQNAMFALSKIGASVTRDQDAKTGTRAQDLLFSGRPFQASLAKTIVQNNAEALQAVERAIRLPYSVSNARNPNTNSTATFVPNLLELQKPFYLLSLRAKLAAHEGQIEAAWRDSLMALQMASRVREGGGTLIEQMIASSWSQRTHAALRDLIPKLPQGRYKQAVAASQPNRAQWQAGWRADYRLASVALQEIQRRPEIKSQFVYNEEDYEWNIGDVMQGLVPYLPQRWTYQPGRTLEMLTAHTRASLEDVANCPSKASAIKDAPLKNWELLQANTLGVSIVKVLKPHAASANDRFCKLMLEHAVTVSMLELRERQWQNQVPPGRLGLDPYTQKPLQWDARTRTIKAGNGDSFRLGF